MGIACDGGGGGGGDDDEITGITLDAAFNNRSFDNPVKLVQHPTNDDRWYVVEQGGIVRTFLGSSGTATTIAADIPIAVGDGEQGLLGMAFDPSFTSNRRIYLAYTDASNEDLVLQRWVAATTEGLTFTASTELLRIPHPGATNHNGSDLAFGDDDFLYYSTGDGANSSNGQNTRSLLGKILRLDVTSTPPSGKTYAIPMGSTGNPFRLNPQCDAGSGADDCPEIYAWGFRNPWRMNFDSGPGGTDRLYVGDVGEADQEEIDRVVRGGNYGWDCFEGEVQLSNTPACNSGDFEAPEAVYDQGSSGGNAVTGGTVYRGSVIPGLQGFYLYADFFRGPILAFDVDVSDGPVRETTATQDSISAFGQGRDGEVYVVDYDGTIWKIVPTPG